ncbi:MAG: protein-disulfide reductase DsbD domain-containing protein [Paracoccaceae bacterium]
MVLALAAGLAPVARGPQAQSIVSTGGDLLQVALVPGRLSADGVRVAGLRLRLAPGWKTYWRHPGETGIPPRLEWSGSTNLVKADLLWPRPIVFESFGATTLGYGGEVLLPVRLTPRDPSQTIGLRLDLTLGVCREICILEEREISVAWPPELIEGVGAVADGLATVPGSGRDLGLQEVRCRLRPDGGALAFAAELRFSHPLGDAKVIVEGPPDTWAHNVQSRSDGPRLLVDARLERLTPESWVTREDIRLTVLTTGRAADVRGCLAAD